VYVRLVGIDAVYLLSVVQGCQGKGCLHVDIMVCIAACGCTVLACHAKHAGNWARLSWMSQWGQRLCKRAWMHVVVEVPVCFFVPPAAVARPCQGMCACEVAAVQGPSSKAQGPKGPLWNVDGVANQRRVKKLSGPPVDHQQGPDHDAPKLSCLALSRTTLPRATAGPVGPLWRFPDGALRKKPPGPFCGEQLPRCQIRYSVLTT
jgi:hypothetical protein